MICGHPGVAACGASPAPALDAAAATAPGDAQGTGMAPVTRVRWDTPCPRVKDGTWRQVALGCTSRSTERMVPPSPGPSVSPRVRTILLAELSAMDSAADESNTSVGKDNHFKKFFPSSV